MLIDSDLMDGEYLRGENDDELYFMIDAYRDGLYIHDHDDTDAFLLGRQYERNQQKDDGK